jgi:hypothetical protein
VLRDLLAQVARQFAPPLMRDVMALFVASKISNNGLKLGLNIAYY